MRVILQRARGASVTIPGPDGPRTVGSFDGPGLVALVGVTHGDDAETAAALAEKTAGLRIMSDHERSEISCADLGAPVLVVS